MENKEYASMEEAMVAFDALMWERAAGRSRPWWVRVVRWLRAR